jgi:hypothetical protein
LVWYPITSCSDLNNKFYCCLKDDVLPTERLWSYFCSSGR